MGVDTPRGGGFAGVRMEVPLDKSAESWAGDETLPEGVVPLPKPAAKPAQGASPPAPSPLAPNPPIALAQAGATGGVVTEPKRGGGVRAATWGV
eukprot:scaffold15741_cov45-Isochrysis_galbana.AAC.1